MGYFNVRYKLYQLQISLESDVSLNFEIVTNIHININNIRVKYFLDSLYKKFLCTQIHNKMSIKIHNEASNFLTIRSIKLII